MSKGLHERGLDDDFRKKMERENATLRTRVSELDEELCRVLADWNALVEAVGARTNGTAIGEATQLRARVTALEGTVARLREGLQRIATLTINLNEHGALTMARFASNTLAGRRYCDDGLDPEVAP